MTRIRSILALVLVCVTVLLVSCGSPAVKAPPTYSATQIEEIQRIASKIEPTRDRMQQLATQIQNRDWNNVRSFIHGPLGQVRSDMLHLAEDLFPDAKRKALEASKGMFSHLVEIDQAAQEGNYTQAIRNYAEAIKDFDAFMQLIPNS